MNEYLEFDKFDFDPCDWINSNLSLINNGNRESHVSSLILKLQQQIQEKIKLLEESCNGVLKIIPKVTQDLQALSLENDLLENDLKNDSFCRIKADGNLEDENFIGTIKNIDKIRTKLYDINAAIREAENWDTIMYETKEAIKNGSLEVALEDLKRADNSLQFLTGMEDYDTKVSQLQNLKDDLESDLSSALIKAFTDLANSENPNFDKMIFLIRIFGEIGRSEQVIHYYEKCLKAQINSEWLGLLSSNKLVRDRECCVKTFSDYYNYILEMWKKLLAWNCELFPSNEAIPLHVINSCLNEVAPMLVEILDTKVKDALHTNFDVIATFQDLYDLCRQFKNCADIFFAGAHKFLPTPSASSSMDNIETSPIADEVSWCVLRFNLLHYKPIRQSLLPQYITIERKYLTDFVESLDLEGEDLVIQANKFELGSRVLNDKFVDLFDRAEHLTNGTTFPDLTELIKEFSELYVTRCVKSLPDDEYARLIGNRGNHVPETTSWSLIAPLMSLIGCSGNLASNTSNTLKTLASKIKTSNTCQQFKDLIVGDNGIFGVNDLLNPLLPFLWPCSNDTKYDLGQAFGKNTTSLREVLQECLDAEKLAKLEKFLSDPFADSLLNAMPTASATINEAEEIAAPLCKVTVSRLKKVLTDPIDNQFKGVAKMANIWSDSASDVAKDLITHHTSSIPSFGLIPSEYLTDVGQYLLMLPQYLEAYSLKELDSPYKLAFDLSYSKRHNAPSNHDNAADYWLQVLAEYTGCLFVDEIVYKIPKLNETGLNQLLCDVDYLINLLEDLGFAPNDSLAHVKRLLSLDQKNYHEKIEDEPKHMVKIIAKARQINNS